MFADIVITVKYAGRARPGRCIACQCTDLEACEGGCYWVDAGCFLCSACFAKLPFSRSIVGLVQLEIHRPNRPKKGKSKARGKSA